MSCPIPVIQFRWHVKDFCSVNSKARTLFSGDFTPVGTDVSLCLVYSYVVNSGHEFSWVRVSLKQSRSQNLKMHFRFWVENTKGQIVVPASSVDLYELKPYGAFGPEKSSIYHEPWLQEKLVKDVLVIVCEATPLNQNAQEIALVENHNLIKGVMIYFEQRHCLRMVESNLLKARLGDRFENLFDMEDNSIQIASEFYPSSVMNMLTKYIYEEKLTRDELQSEVDVLYYIACECGLKGLKEICFNYMTNALNDSNIFKYLGVGLICDDEPLMQAALNYLKRNHQGKHLSQLVDMDECEAMKETSPEFHKQMKRPLLSILKML